VPPARSAPRSGSGWTSSAGIAADHRRTREEFVPQMANFEQLGGVSFHKGCYPGQEIVARTQYLGKVKRHLYRAHSRQPAGGR
jgi:folate-binding protein YgfZ